MDRLKRLRLLARWTNPRLDSGSPAFLPSPITPATATAVQVLQVGRDEELRATLSGLLEEDQFHLSDVADAPAALHLLRASPQPMLAVLDCRPPHLQGWQVLSEIAPADRRRDRALSRHVYLAIVAERMPLSEPLLELLRQPRVQVLEHPAEPDLLLGLITLAALDLLLH